MTSNTNDYYSGFPKRARNTWGVRVKRYQARRLFSLIQWEKRVERVLELGPGDGYVAELCRLNGRQYLGVEGSGAVAENLRSAGNEILEQVVPPLPENVGRFDACFVLHMLEHLPDTETAETLLTQVRGQLNSRGLLVVACPDGKKWREDFYRCDPTHSLSLTRESLRRLLSDSGFALTHEIEYSGPIFGSLATVGYLGARLMYSPALDRALSSSSPSLYYRGYLTLLPSLAFVAEAV